jgi:hypothetical protein
VTLPRFIIDTLSVTALVAIATILLARGQDLQSSLLLLGMFALPAVRMIPSTTRLSAALAQVRFRYASTEVIYRELLALRQRPSDLRPDPTEKEECQIFCVRDFCEGGIVVGPGISRTPPSIPWWPTLAVQQALSRP